MNRGGSRPPTAVEDYVTKEHGHPHGPPDRDLAAVELATIQSLAAAAGLTPLVADMMHALRSDPTHQVIGRIVRRTGRRFTEVAGEYNDHDLAFELAQDHLDAEDRFERCPECGTRPDETLDPDTWRPLEHGRWKWELHTCGWCEVGRRANNRLSEDDRKHGASYRLAPRGDWDPEIDDGDTDDDWD